MADSDSAKMRALDCACGAADAGMQGVTALWGAMTEEERKVWMDTRADCWPRLDFVVAPAMEAAGRAVEQEHDADWLTGRPWDPLGGQK